MSNLSSRLNEDLKQAMLSGDKRLTDILKGLKSALQYAGVEKGAGVELSEEEVIKVLQKESKKRADAAELYQKANDSGRAEGEQYEKEIIDKYLPELLSKEEVEKLVEQAVSEIGEVDQRSMGQVIGLVREKSQGRAEGALIASLVKERLAK